MGTAFVMKGYEGETIGCAMSSKALSFSGSIHIQGRQPVGGDGAPQWVADIFNANPDVMQIAVGKNDSGVIYYR